MIGRVLRVVVPVALIVVVGAGLWMAFTGSRALAAVDDLQAAADDVQVAIDDTDVPALRSAAADAQDAALRANDALDGPVWGLVAAIPYVGDTPEVARVTASALATAADGLTPLLEVSDVLDPASLYSDGRIAVDELRAAAEPLALASADLDAAAAEIATAPTAADGAWVPASLDAQRADAADQLTEAAEALDTAAAAADVLPALLGADGPRRWFVGLQTPAEARGTGGLPGNFVVLRAERRPAEPGPNRQQHRLRSSACSCRTSATSSWPATARTPACSPTATSRPTSPTRLSCGGPSTPTPCDGNANVVAPGRRGFGDHRGNRPDHPADGRCSTDERWSPSSCPTSTTPTRTARSARSSRRPSRRRCSTGSHPVTSLRIGWLPQSVRS